MKYDFSNKIKKNFKDDALIKKKYGQLFNQIKVCLSIIESQDSLAEIPNAMPTRRHKLSDGTWGLDLSKNWRMIIKPLSGDEPQDIKNIIIEDIKDYH